MLNAMYSLWRNKLRRQRVVGEPGAPVDRWLESLCEKVASETKD